MLRTHSREFETLLQIGDVVLAAAVFVGLAQLPGVLRPGPAPEMVGVGLLPLGLVASLGWPLALGLVDLYASQRRQDLRQLLRPLLFAGGVAVLCQAATAFLFSAPVSKAFPLICATAQLAVLATLRILLFSLLRWLRRGGHNTRNVLIAGSGPRAAYVAQVIEHNPGWGLQIIGFIDQGAPPSGPSVDVDRIFELRHMRELLSDQVIDEVIVACPRSMLEAVVSVVDASTAAGVPITLLSDIFGDYLPTPRVKRFGALPALHFAPVHHSAAGLAVKRVLDVVVAATVLGLAAPLLGAAALAIKLSSPGPILFRQVRCSLNGRLFVMPKLRTMYVDAEERRLPIEHLNEMDGPVFKMRQDPRITPVGRFLRRFSLDELPQLWSVLRGDMSLVGPRPPIPVEVASYKTFERRRLSMRPGLTCIWQVSGRNEIGFDDWVRLDLEYIDTWSLRTDLRILLQTLPAVLSGAGAS